MAFDLDKVIAERPPSTRRIKPFEFTFDGKTYKMRSDLDVIGLRAANTGDMVTALRRALSPDDYEEISTSPTLLEYETLVVLLTAYYDHVGGVKAGESSASSTSSKSTARPSKRTSKGSTRRAS
jgi:hypothetical protein